MVQSPQPACPSRPWRSWRGAFVALGLVLAGVAGAQTATASTPLAISVRGGMDPQTGDATMVQPGLGVHSIDFGHVANGGLRPRTGAQIDDEGTSWYVATMELTVVRNADNSIGIQSVRTPTPSNARPGFAGATSLGPDITAFPTNTISSANAGAFRSAGGAPVMSPIPRRARQQRQGGRRDGIYIPSAGQALAEATTHVDVYVRLDGHDEGEATVWFSSPQSGGLGNAVELMFVETLVATTVAIGQPFLCQVSFKVPPSEWGHQNANVLFSARPTGQ